MFLPIHDNAEWLIFSPDLSIRLPTFIKLPSKRMLYLNQIFYDSELSFTFIFLFLNQENFALKFLLITHIFFNSCALADKSELSDVYVALV
jgi:hypothetical protein